MSPADLVKKTQAQLQENLTRHLKFLLPFNSEVYEYAVLPPGKMIRPLMVKAIYSDLQKKPLDCSFSFNENHAYLASAIEIHHAYTLIHDDLPAMDNDDFRRGKPSTHKAFGEWQALLAGDGLLNASYRLLSQINSPSLKDVLNFFSWALGPKGLILGQWLDLDIKEKYLNHVLKIHELKTSRLMQTSLISSLLLTPKEKIIAENPISFFKLFKMGHHIGIMFQLLDDLLDMAIQNENEHEHEINPFLQFPEEAFQKLFRSLATINHLLETYELKNLKLVLSQFYIKTQGLMETNQKLIEKNTNILLDPVMVLLNRLS